MFSKNFSMPMITSVATVMLFSVAGSEQAFTHGSQVFGFTLPNGEFRLITFIMGHSNEPTRATEEGKWDGEHNMELFIRDTRTGLNLAEADLKVDKYFYKNAKKYNKAVDKGFEPLVEDTDVSEVHGDPGYYYARQVLAQPGFYGYHVTGTVDYFGVTDVEIDVKAMCRDAPDGGSEHVTASDWFGGFGCTDDIDDVKFSQKNKRGNSDKDD